MIDAGRRNVLGINISVIDYDAAVERIAQCARKRQPLAISALAVHGLMTGVLDPEHRYRLNNLDMLCPDGQPVRWALNWMHRAELPDRVYGPDLMLKVCQRATDDKLSIFLFGGSDKLLEELEQELTASYPRLRIVGKMASRFRTLSAAERDEVVARINQSRAQITFVGLGCPRQEVWAFEFRERLSMPILAVGAAFNFHAGHLPQAPPYLQKRGLEWAYRLFREPRRLWKRYFWMNPMYVGLLACQMLRIHKPDSTGVQPRREILYG